MSAALEVLGPPFAHLTVWLFLPVAAAFFFFSPSMSLLKWAVIQFVNVLTLGNHIVLSGKAIHKNVSMLVSRVVNYFSETSLMEYWSFLLIYQQGKNPIKVNLKSHKINFQDQISLKFWMDSRGDGQPHPWHP